MEFYQVYMYVYASLKNKRQRCLFPNLDAAVATRRDHDRLTLGRVVAQAQIGDRVLMLRKVALMRESGHGGHGNRLLLSGLRRDSRIVDLDEHARSLDHAHLVVDRLAATGCDAARETLRRFRRHHRLLLL